MSAARPGIFAINIVFRKHYFKQMRNFFGQILITSVAFFLFLNNSTLFAVDVFTIRTEKRVNNQSLTFRTFQTFFDFNIIFSDYSV